MTVEKGKRKVRSDKKREVQPTIPIPLKDAIYRMHYITNTPVKDVAERICEDGLTSKKVMEVLSKNFRRTVRLGNTMYMGDPDRSPTYNRTAAGKTGRIGIRFKQHTFENVSTLAFAMDCTPSRATALLLDASLRNSDFINSFFHEHLKRELDDQRLAELKKVLQYINANNPYDEKISWVMLLNYIYEEIKDSASTVSDTISTFITKWK